MKIPKIVKTKKFWFGLILLAVILFFIFRAFRRPSDTVQSEKVKRQDLKQTVLATGQVTSQTDLSLSFKISGIVSRVSVNEGDKVKIGQELAVLEQKDQIAALTSARGSLAQAQANYNKVLAGASGEEVAVYQVALDNAKDSLEITKKQQQVLVDNAYKALLNSGISALAATYNTGGVTATVSGTYSGVEQGIYRITIDNTSGGLYFNTDGLENSRGVVSTAPQPMGTKGLFLSFSNTSVPQGSIWTVTIPNTQASTYVANYNAYQAALQTQASALAAAENAVATAQANLDLKKALARPADIQVAEAQILSAQGQVQAAGANLENTYIRAPAAGTITKVDVKVGELATALKPVIILQDIGNLYVEAQINEANIAALELNQSVEVSFDAFGPDRKFEGRVQAIDPASTLVSGVVNYKVTVGLDKLLLEKVGLAKPNKPDLPETETGGIKPGMTANLNILTAEKFSALAVPQRSVLTKDGKRIVRVITDDKQKTYREVEVTTGLEADGGLVEILSGLGEGQEVVTFIKLP